jgi:hypothetical protein
MLPLLFVPVALLSLLPPLLLLLLSLPGCGGNRGLTMNVRSSLADTSIHGWVGLKHRAATSPSCPVSLLSKAAIVLTIECTHGKLHTSWI